MFRPIVFCLIFLITVSCRMPCCSQNSSKYQIQGMRVFNFAQFTEWPDDVFASPEAPFVIGILGGDPFGEFLDQLVTGEKIHNHPIVIRRFSSEEEASSSNLLFVSRDFPFAGMYLHGLSEGKQVLTVSEAPGFAETGGVIGFYNENDEVKFEVNMDALRKSRLKLSSKVLRLARRCCDNVE
jgi:hypothetical protein